MQYQERKFDLPTLEGISEKQVEVHLGLYAGYVKHVNLMAETLKTYASYGDKASDGDKFAIAELRRRFSFEFNGMRMHEYYFEQFEGSAKDASDGKLKEVVSEKYGSWDEFLNHIKTVASSRGIGWTVVAQDPIGETVHTYWVSDHEVGQLSGLNILLALDMWEHAFMVDYTPAEKKQYVDAFFSNLNWSVVESRLK